MGLSATQLKRLRSAFECSRKAIVPFREKRDHILRQSVGYQYSDGGASDKVPLNLIDLARTVYESQLAARAPRVLVTTRFKQLKSHASRLELALNHLIEETQLGRTIRRVVTDALYSVGIVKIGLDWAGQVEYEGATHDVGQPFIDRVSLDDFVFDTTSHVFEGCGFMASRCRVPLEMAKNNPAFDRAAREKLVSTSRSYDSDEDGAPHERELSQGEGEPDEYEDHVELWDVYLPQSGMMLTVPDTESWSTPLRQWDWDGPEGGPFRMLGFSEVPGNILPLAPAALWVDLHDLANTLFRKLGRQAGRQKTVFGGAGSAFDDSQRIINANDGEGIKLEQPDKCREFKTGGIDQPNLAFTLAVKDLFVYLTGNLDSLGGLSPQAQTAKQDQLLAENASKRMSQMQDRTVEFVKGVVTDLAWYLWTDPLIELPLSKRTPDGVVEVPVRYTPEEREGDFLEYNFEIEPYSMQYPSPSTRLATISQVFERFIAPFAGQLQQQGMVINFESLMRTVAKYTNMTELDDLLIWTGGQQSMESPVGTPPAKAAVTTRRYERINRPGATAAGKSATMQQVLLGGNPQAAEMEAAIRPVG